jgi:hypothetical protein
VATSPDGTSNLINGEVFSITFTVAANAPEGDVPVSVAYKDVRDGSNFGMDVTVRDGVVTMYAPVVYGDADGDGSVTLGDVNRIVDWLAGKAPMPEAGTRDFLAADVNGDGIINLADVNLIIDQMLGRIAKFPVE